LTIPIIEFLATSVLFTFVGGGIGLFIGHKAGYEKALRDVRKAVDRADEKNAAKFDAFKAKYKKRDSHVN